MDTTGEIIKAARTAIISNIFVIMSIMITIILAITIIIIDTIKRKNKYVVWKKQTINLGVFSKEWERTDDVVLQQLFDENQRLEAENKLLKKENSKLSFVVFLQFVLALFSIWISSYKKNND